MRYLKVMFIYPGAEHVRPSFIYRIDGFKGDRRGETNKAGLVQLGLTYDVQVFSVASLMLHGAGIFFLKCIFYFSLGT